MTTATATPSTLITAPDFAAAIRKTLRAIFSWLKEFNSSPSPTSLAPNVLKDIGLRQSQLMALEFA